MAFPVIIAVLVLAFIITFVGLKAISIIRVLGGMMLLISGMVIIISGVEGLNNLMTLGIGSISIALGGWFMIMDLFKNPFSGEEQNEDYEEDDYEED